MSGQGLTPKQDALLTWLEGRMRETRVVPTYEEMREALGLRSKGGVHKLLHSLQERGYVRVTPYRARSLELVRRDDPAQ